ncbi:hypothetical protein SALBM311S_11450 [Streptomyces alboniger]
MGGQSVRAGLTTGRSALGSLDRMIEVTNLTKRYGDKTVVDRFSFTGQTR